jgi:hypothetical protein
MQCIDVSEKPAAVVDRVAMYPDGTNLKREREM